MQISVLLVAWGWTWDEVRAGWLEIEELGFDVCYMGDDLFPHPPTDETLLDNVYEPWTVIPAMAALTSRIKLGSLVSPAGRRHPGLFAKMTSVADQVSGGRVIVGRGLGNAPDQQRSMSMPFPAARERFEMLQEEVRIMKAMWTQDRTTFEGRYWQVRDAVNEPKPVRKPHPEVLLGFGGGSKMPRLAGELATRINLFGRADEKVAAIARRTREHAVEFGRSEDEIIAGRGVGIAFTDSRVDPEDEEAALRELATQIGDDPDQFVQEQLHYGPFYIGPPDGAAQMIRRRVTDLGLDEVVLSPETIGRNPYPRFMEVLRTFAREVMPALR